MEENKKTGKKRNIVVYLLTVTGSLTLTAVVLVLVLSLYQVFQKALHSETAKVSSGEALAEMPQEVYTGEQLEEILAENTREAGNTSRMSLLRDIQNSLENGVTVVETLRPYYTDKIVLVSNGKYHFVPIRDELAKNNYAPENLLQLDNGELQYVWDGEIISHKGIDVSKHQGDIDWKQVSEDGVEFAFVRLAYRGYGKNGTLVEDATFEKNIEGALAAGVKVGVYIYTQAINEEELIEEANLVLEKLAPYEIDCPVVIDVEKVSAGNGRMNDLSVAERTHLVKLFCEIMEEAGYRPMIYHNMEMGTLMLELSELEQYSKWFAYYNKELYYPYAYDIWQYSEKGSVKGIQGEVDMNISFGPIWQE